MTSKVLRQPSELRCSDELDFLKLHDSFPKPEGWQLSPQRVKDFILGGKVGDRVISQKIYGNDDVVEKSIVTLIGQRGLLLVGEPGTAKSLLSELLAAAISDNSRYTVQGSAGIVEENIRYSWNYALLLNKGCTLDALVPGPLYRSMREGAMMRFEEITRCPTEVQDNLIPVLSDKILHIPELEEEEEGYLLCKPGFNIIATANLRDRGVNEMSSALKRRFNFIAMRPLESTKDQVTLIHTEVCRELERADIDVVFDQDTAQLLATMFSELREGLVVDVAIDKPSTVMSMAEAVSVGVSAALQSYYFGSSQVLPSQIASQMVGTVIKDDVDDSKRFADYLRVVARKKKSELWQELSSYQHK